MKKFIKGFIGMYKKIFGHLEQVGEFIAFASILLTVSILGAVIINTIREVIH